MPPAPGCGTGRVVRARQAGRHLFCRGGLPGGAARQDGRPGGGGADGESGPGCPQPPLPEPAPGSGARAGVVRPAAGDGPDRRRPGGPPPCAPGAGLHLHRRRRGVELARGAPASLPGADIGTAFGDPPGGLAEPPEPDWRGTLVRGPRRPLGRAGPVPGEVGWADTEWAGREYAGGMHTDGRVRRRPGEMGKAWQKRPGRPLPEIFPGQAEQRAAHRMLSNPGVKMEHTGGPHCGATCGGCRAGRFVPATGTRRRRL